VAISGKWAVREKRENKRKPLPWVATGCHDPKMVRNAMKEGLPGDRLRFVTGSYRRGGPVSMLYAGLDLSRKRLDFHLLDGEGATVEVSNRPGAPEEVPSSRRRFDTRPFFRKSGRKRWQPAANGTAAKTAVRTRDI
jgi:hypothetical protein